MMDEQKNRPATGMPPIGRDAPAVRLYFSRENMLKGMRYFAILTIAGLTILFIYTSTPQTLTALEHLEPRYILVAIALSAFDLWLGGWRNHIFVRKILPGVSQSLCLRANLANLFMGAITPSQSGGGPAQLFVLYRGGLPLASAISVSVINFLSTLVFFLVAASFALVVVRERFSQALVKYLIQYGFAVFAVLLVIFLIALWYPSILVAAVNGVSRLLAKTGLRWGEVFARLGQRAAGELEAYRQSCVLFLRRQPLLLPYSFALTIIMYVNKFTLAYFLMRGLGVDADFLSMLAIQTLLLFILYFSPSPGGSGIAELSTGALMATLMPKYLLPIFTLLNRFFLLYLPAILGAFILLAAIRPTATVPAGQDATAGDPLESQI